MLPMPLTELEAKRLIQSFNVVIAQNESYETQIIELMQACDALRVQIETLRKQNERLQIENRDCKDRLLKLQARIIERENAEQALAEFKR